MAVFCEACQIVITQTELEEINVCFFCFYCVYILPFFVLIICTTVVTF